MCRREFDVRKRRDGALAAPDTAAIAAPKPPSAMSTFCLVGLAAENFEPFFAMRDDELAALGARRVVADAPVGFPCRVSLADAEPGDELLLLPFEHLSTRSPYRASGPVFVRRGVRRAVLPPGEIPPYVTRRWMSVRAYDADDMMVDAEVCDGVEVRGAIERMLSDDAVAFVHLHNAKRGCFSCRVERVG
jgi:Protein of unknown function (DUF1203)